MPSPIADATHVGLYVHLPFCRQRCIYCDFPTQVGSWRDLEGYLPLLAAELDLYAGEGLSVGSIFLGGGTPSLLTGSQFSRLMALIRSRLPVSAGAEVTLEANPGTVSAGSFEAYVAGGLNRLSLGAQTFDAALLQTLNRLHGPEAIAEAVAQARAAGLTNVNIDLIYGLPSQTLTGWQDTVARALALDPPHLSLYPLAVEPGTPLEGMVAVGKLLPAPEGELMAMYEWAKPRLEAAGYLHYEIANFARPGREAQHNLVYWRNGPYIGLGMGAHSHFAGRRYSNPPTLGAYRQRVADRLRPWREGEAESLEVAIEETVFLNLRLLAEGLNPSDFMARFGLSFDARFAPVLADLQVDHLIRRGDDGCWRLTPRAVPVAHEVFVKFMG